MLAASEIEKEIPKKYLCFLTKQIMLDPVITADGHTYEREAIEDWLKKQNTSPETKLELSNKNLIPNIDTRKAITEYVEQYPELREKVYFSASLIIKLTLAIEEQNLSEIKSILAKDKRVLDKLFLPGSTFWHLACTEGSPEILDAILNELQERHIDLILGTKLPEDFKPIYANLLLETSLTKLDFKKADLLFKLGAELEQIDEAENTLLHRLIIKNKIEPIAWLLDKNPDLEQINKEGNTALHLAAQHGYKVIVLTLLKAGASHTSINKNGNTPIQVALQADELELVQDMDTTLAALKKEKATKLAKENKDKTAQIAELEQENRVKTAQIEELNHRIKNIELLLLKKTPEGINITEYIKIKTEKERQELVDKIDKLVPKINPEALIKVLDVAPHDEHKALTMITEDPHLYKLFVGREATLQAQEVLNAFYPAYKSYLNQQKLIYSKKNTCILTLKGHAYSVNCVAVMQDGTIVSGSGDRTLKIWNKEGKCLQTLEGHTNSVICVAVMPNGNIVSGSLDKTLKIWNKEGKCLQTLKGHEALVRCVAVMPDGTIVSGSDDKTLKIWDTEGKYLHTLKGHLGSVSCVAVMPNGNIVSGSDDKTLKIWNTEGNCLHTLKGHTGLVFCVAVMANGHIVSGSYDDTLKIWDTEGNCLQTFKGHKDWMSCVAVVPNGTIVSGSDDKTLKIWDTEGKCLHTLKGHEHWVKCVAVMQDGTIVSGSHDHTLKIWDTELLGLKKQTVKELEQKVAACKIM